MSASGYLDIDALHQQLRRACRHGATAARLLRYAPEVIDIIAPAAEHPDADAPKRALHTEALINAGVERIGADAGKALSIVLALTPAMRTKNLEARRSDAAHLLGLTSVETFRRDWHEGALLFDLAMEIYRLQQAGPAPESFGAHDIAN
ncbi:hypothetical protein RKE29_12915 [Streptomyces sp. B1866]|uniref:hypothetical protein n=1 Tax=Streptomyces sp. B1866 TaxID=3075431 RepID=UPI00289250AA|nr:hypothetical protein [Streptomyces sp. B1866]MDT3397542.1 hypothetical protein [Streptomyces sp. B1866]